MTTHETNGTSTHRDALTQLCLTVLPVWERHLANSRFHAEAAVSDMMGAFSVAVEAISDKSMPDIEVQSCIERMYAGFQYQDRVNQMLSVVQDDIHRLVQVLQTPSSTPDALSSAAWLKQLESRYTMPDQRRMGADEMPNATGNVSFF